MKLKNITFTFENCDMITIDGKYIGNFLVDEIKTSIQRVACNAIMKMDIAKVIAIEIHKDANKKRCELGCENRKQMTFDRFLEYDDITSIEFELVEEYVDDGEEPITEHYDYFVNWVGDSDMENEAQHSYVSKDNNLYIVISDGKNVEDYFDFEMIDDSEYMDFQFEMYDVGDENNLEV
jgi:hypothetical protein